MSDRTVAVSITVVVPEEAAGPAAFTLTRALVDALPSATQGSLSIVAMDEDDEDQEEGQ